MPEHPEVSCGLFSGDARHGIEDCGRLKALVEERLHLIGVVGYRHPLLLAANL